MSEDMYQVWRTITLGLHQTAAAYRKALQAGGYWVNEWADDLLGKIPFATTPTEVSLYRVTGRQLGLTATYTTAQFFAAATSHGFTKLPAETGPALRLGYDEQPDGEVIRVGMEPIADSDGSLDVFSVGRDGGDRWLSARYAGPAGEWAPGYVWVMGRS